MRLWLLVSAVVISLAVSGPATARDDRPYDGELFRLAEILGALHYLRGICNGEEGQLWRDEMAALVEAEGASAQRRVRLVRQFNDGYRSFQRTYRTCTRSAELAIERFFVEGGKLTETISTKFR